MAHHDYVALNLAGPSAAEAAQIHLQLLDGALALIRDMLAVDGEPKRTEVAARFERCRQALSEGTGAGELAALGEACLSAGQGIVAEHEEAMVERAKEMSSLVGALREIVAAVGSEMTTLNSGLEQSSARFDAISQLTDPMRIKRQLFEEIYALKRLTVDRRRTWEEKTRRLNHRIESLEHQLVTTRSEASTDPLTEISNRRVFERTCEDWIQTPGAAFVLAILDVDELKLVNDTHGHDGGDSVLYFVAQTLVRSLRAGDVVARIGGDEFVVMAPNLTLAQAEHRLRTIMSGITDPALAKIERPPYMTAVSCGVAEFSAGDTFATLMKRADEALYSAKRQGKNRLVAKPVPYIRDLLKG